MRGNALADIRISDTLAQTRTLDQFRHLDREERALTERIAAHSVEKELHEQKKDVEEAERAIAEQPEDHARGGEYHPERKKKQEAQKEEPPPEISEGHLLDLKA